MYCHYTRHLDEPRDPSGENFETYAFMHGYDYIVNNIAPGARLELGFANGEDTLILGLTDNFIGLREGDSEQAGILQRLLGKNDSAKWYLDTEKWRWRVQNIYS